MINFGALKNTERLQVMQDMWQALGWKVSDVGLVVYGFALGWGASLLGWVVKYIFHTADGKQPVSEV